MEKVFNKLVRDKIPQIIIDNGEKPYTRILSDEEYKLELEKKLNEEYTEVLNSNGRDRLEELSDMLEIIKCLAILEGSSLEEVEEIANKKSLKRGSFKDKIFLEKTTD